MARRKRDRRLVAIVRSLPRRGYAWLQSLRYDPAARERASATAAFALIFAFGAASLDYLITGGPDWNPGAEAAALGRRPAIAVQALAPSDFVGVPQLELASLAPMAEAPQPTEDLLGGPDAILPNMAPEIALAQELDLLIDAMAKPATASDLAAAQAESKNKLLAL